jgi:hypothetical protein
MGIWTAYAFGVITVNDVIARYITHCKKTNGGYYA